MTPPPIAIRADDVYAAELAARFPVRAVETDAPTHRDEECAASSRAYEAELTALCAERDEARAFARSYNAALIRERDELRAAIAEERERSKVYERLMHSAARALMEQGDRLPPPSGYVHPSGHSEHLAGGVNGGVRL